MQLVCLDTHILVWGVKEESTPGQEAMVYKAKLFFKWLDDNGMKAIIPSVVLGEFLILIPAESHSRVIESFQRNFLIAPYDAAAASCFAKIWQGKRANEKKNEDVSGTRAKLNADRQIVATAITHGASCIYSYDEDLAKFAEGYIEVKEIPDMPDQLNLLETSG